MSDPPPDSIRTPLPSPSDANARTPSRMLGGTPHRTPPRQRDSFRDFVATRPPQLRRTDSLDLGPSALWSPLSDEPLVNSPSQQTPPRLMLSRSQYNEALSNPQNAPMSLLLEIERDLDDQIRDLEAVIHNNRESLVRLRRHHHLIADIIHQQNGRTRRRHGIRARSPLSQQDNYVEGRIFHEHRTPSNTPVPVRTPDVRQRGRGRRRRYSLDGTRRRFLEEKDQIKF